MNLKIDNPEDKDSIQEVLKLGKAGDFWKLIVQSIDDGIKGLEEEVDSEDLKALPADEYKTESEILKAKIKHLRELRNKPDDIIGQVEDPNQGGEAEESQDVYD